MTTIPQNEYAEIVVNGMRFRDWKTVKVEIFFGSFPRQFEFTTSEDEPIPKDWGAYRIKPGDPCQIFLAGQLAVTGYVNIRRVAYDAYSHSIQIAGRSRTQDAADSTSTHAPGEFKNYDFQSIARKELQPFGINLRMLGGGGESNKKFKRVQRRPGETVGNFLDRLARMRNMYLGDDEFGDLVALAQSESSATESLIEGKNIKIAVGEIRDDEAVSQQIMIGQAPGNDQQWGKQANQIKDVIKGTSNRFRPYLVMTERPPDDKKDATTRNKFEGQWLGSTFINQDITVYGWLKSNGELWKVGEYVFVNSPMLILNNSLAIQKVTFTQSDQSGTETTLHLVLPKDLGGQPSVSGSTGAST